MKATVSAPGEIADEHKAPISQNAAQRDAGALVDQRERRQDEHARQQIEAQQIQHGKSDRKQQRSDERLARLHVDRDGKPAASARIAPAI